jgi:hypothetical protein
MNKNKIISIACLMAIALLGLVVVQVNWILHDVNLRKEKFNQQALDALNKAVKKLETGLTVHYIAKKR